MKNSLTRHYDEVAIEIPAEAERLLAAPAPKL
jgi:hypothetical protein